MVIRKESIDTLPPRSVVTGLLLSLIVTPLVLFLPVGKGKSESRPKPNYTLRVKNLELEVESLNPDIMRIMSTYTSRSSRYYLLGRDPDGNAITIYDHSKDK